VDGVNITFSRDVTTVNIHGYDGPVPRTAPKPYHHGNLRAALVEAGAELARASGPDGVVLREVARRTGVSHNAAYRHFADRDELLSEIAGLANGQLEQAMLRRMAEVSETDPAERARARLRATGRAYVEFALSEPGLFNVAFCPIEDAEPDPAEAAPYQLLGQVLDELVDTGALSPEARSGADVVCWAGVHGLSVLLLEGPLREVPAADRQGLVEKMIATIEQGLNGSVAQ
jgi:AcrR family transcriptional regulator